MKPDPNKALVSAALPTLADSSSIAAVAPGALPLATQLLQAQLKLHLLTSEHIVLSDGFIYDNPAIWDILDENLAQNFSSKRRDGTSTLLVQVDGEAIDGATVDPDKAFRVWAFGADGARHLEPSALRLLGREKRDAPETIRSLNKLTSTLDDYAYALTLPYLRAARPHIQSLIMHCDVLPKPSSRYEVFHDNVQKFFDFLVEAQLKQLEGPFSRLYDYISQLRDFLSSGKRISRSNIEEFDSKLWWQLAPYLNQFRLRGYLPTENAGFCTYLPSPANDAISKLMLRDEVASTGKKERWLIALNKLTFDEVFRIRSRPSFRNVLEELGEIWRTNGEGASERYCAVLRTKWRDELAAAVSAVAPNCVIDKKKGEGKWIPPVSQFSGFAAGATTLAILGAAATQPVVGLAVVGVGGAVYLSLLGAKAIADSFLIDRPELAAHLVAGKVIEFVSLVPRRQSDEV